MKPNIRSEGSQSRQKGDWDPFIATNEANMITFNKQTTRNNHRNHKSKREQINMTHYMPKIEAAIRLAEGTDDKDQGLKQLARVRSMLQTLCRNFPDKGLPLRSKYDRVLKSLEEQEDDIVVAESHPHVASAPKPVAHAPIDATSYPVVATPHDYQPAVLAPKPLDYDAKAAMETFGPMKQRFDMLTREDFYNKAHVNVVADFDRKKRSMGMRLERSIQNFPQNEELATMYEWYSTFHESMKRKEERLGDSSELKSAMHDIEVSMAQLNDSLYKDRWNLNSKAVIEKHIDTTEELIVKLDALELEGGHPFLQDVGRKLQETNSTLQDKLAKASATEAESERKNATEERLLKIWDRVQAVPRMPFAGSTTLESTETWIKSIRDIKTFLSDESDFVESVREEYGHKSIGGPLPISAYNSMLETLEKALDVDGNHHYLREFRSQASRYHDPENILANPKRKHELHDDTRIEWLRKDNNAAIRAAQFCAQFEELMLDNSNHEYRDLIAQITSYNDSFALYKKKAIGDVSLPQKDSNADEADLEAAKEVMALKGYREFETIFVSKAKYHTSGYVTRDVTITKDGRDTGLRAEKEFHSVSDEMFVCTVEKSEDSPTGLEVVYYWMVFNISGPDTNGVWFIKQRNATPITKEGAGLS